MDTTFEVVRGLLPTAGVLLLFGLAIQAIVRADAAERAGRARVEALEDAAAAGSSTTPMARPLDVPDPGDGTTTPPHPAPGPTS